MVDIVLLGGGGHAREILDIIRAVNRRAPTFNVAGFLDETKAARDGEVEGRPVISDFGWFKETGFSGRVVLAVGDFPLRTRFIALAEAGGLEYETIISPRAEISGSAELAVGCVLFSFSFVSSKVRLGAHCHVNAGAVISHDVQAGDLTIVSPGANLAGRSKVGARTLIGAGAVVLPDVTVGDDCVVGAGTVVTKDLPDGSIAAGVPARIIGRNADVITV